MRHEAGGGVGIVGRLTLREVLRHALMPMRFSGLALTYLWGRDELVAMGGWPCPRRRRQCWERSLARCLALATLTAGALFNAYLNRRRDRAIHRFEQLNLLSAMTTEISHISKLIEYQSKMLSTVERGDPFVSIINPITLTQIYKSNLSKLYLLPVKALPDIIAFYALLHEHEYNASSQGIEVNMSSDGAFRSFNLSWPNVDKMLVLNHRLLNACELCLSACRPELEALSKTFARRGLTGFFGRKR